jgi:phosphoribosylaminoimidazole-succinocarboxamide synthase
MKKGKKLYEGKAKIIYATNDKNLVIQYFKDDATAFNNQKKSTIEGKGVLNNRISEHILSNLSQIGIKNHLVKRLNMREQVIKLVEIIPIEFIVRNVATGSITKRLGIEDGTVLKEPLIEYCLKDDKLGDPLIAEEHILTFDWASKKEIEKVKKMILRINDFMIGMFRGVGIKLIDFKLEFGRLKVNGKDEVILADEISPDTCRLWDSITDKKLDKDRFRKNLGDLIPAYTEVAKRLGYFMSNQTSQRLMLPSYLQLKGNVNENFCNHYSKKRCARSPR